MSLSPKSSAQPPTFVENLELYTSSLRAMDTAMAKMDLAGLFESGQKATGAMVSMLQDLDGRLERVERRPANDA